MLCLVENEIKDKKVYILLLHLLSKSFPNKLLETVFVFVLAYKKKSSTLLKFNSAKTALFGKIYSLKPLCVMVHKELNVYTGPGTPTPAIGRLFCEKIHI